MSNYVKKNLQAAQNLSLPIWTKNVYPIPMKNITALDFNLRSNTTILKRLNGGESIYIHLIPKF